MKFSELDARMRIFEAAHDHSVLPGIYMVARLDGRAFTRLTRERHRFQVPFDPGFRDLMIETARHLMDCGLRIPYAHTESDEISLLFHLAEQGFGRRLRKYHSILAGEASAKFSCLLGEPVSFDCRISQLPRPEQVVDYFRWRQEDAHRNALHAHCYWTLRQAGKDAQTAAALLYKASAAEKVQLLAQHGIDFDALPAWQKHGVGLYWEEYHKPATDPRTGTPVIALRHRLKTDLCLPAKQAYADLIRRFLA